MACQAYAALTDVLRPRQDVVGDFAEAAFKLSVGGMSQQLVKTRFGYHIILVEGRR